MPPEKRRPPASVMALLAEEPYRFEFFQAVRVLGGFFSQRSGASSKSIIGEEVRFRNSLNLAFPPSELESLVLDMREPDPKQASTQTPFEALQRAYITPSFIGLTGNSGTLPRNYTERLLEREMYHRDRGARVFLDIFSSRAVALFYHAWEKYRLYFQYERDRRERFQPLVMALIGLGSSSTQDRLADDKSGVFDESLAFYSGVLRMGPRPAHAIARVLADYFRVPIKLTQFVGRWFDVPPDQATMLGGANVELGKNALCGPRIWQRQTRVRLDIGPLARDRFEDFLPQGSATESLNKLLAMLTGATLEYEVHLKLKREEVPSAQFSPLANKGVRLGWDCWLQTAPAISDRDDAAYEVTPCLS